MAFDCSLLQKALDQSEEMARLGEQDEWEKVNHLDEQRKQLLKRCLGEGVPEAEKQTAIDYLQKIQQLNESLADQATEKHVEIQKTLQLLHKRKQASDAYDACP